MPPECLDTFVLINNLRGFSASVIGTQFLAYVAVDSREDANKVIEILEKA